jgi:hypothetical protein
MMVREIAYASGAEIEVMTQQKPCDRAIGGYALSVSGTATGMVD